MNDLEGIIKEEIKLLEQLDFIKVRNNDNGNIKIKYMTNEISIKFYLNTITKNYKEKIKVLLIKSKVYNNEILDNTVSQFILNFKWRNNVRFKDFLINFDKEIKNKFNEKKSNLRVFEEYDIKNKNKFKNLHIENILQDFNLSNINSLYYITILINLLSLIIKSLCGLYGYSGENDSPKFGDYEAQRHWMELTYNLNATDWYTDSENNPKEYWPLDYPPLSGYYSYIWGYILNIFMPKSVELKSSWGFESLNHKILMRFSVIVSDLLFFHIPVYLLLKKLFINNNKKKKILHYCISMFLLLCSPLLIIIDHGHFQYNCVMHGFFILSVYFLFSHRFVLSIIIFSLCINFKQMGMYYALPFPFYVVKVIFEEMKNKKNKTFAYLYLVLSLAKYAFYTILTMTLIWGPWITSNRHMDLVNRIFPLWRGIFEDKVATFWCTLNIFYKINKVSQKSLIILSLVLTIIPSIAACFSILIHHKSSKKITNLAFFIISFSFFFFSFHVHEKTILVPFLAFLLNYFSLFKILPSFTLVSLFSLYPLLKREGQHIPYFILLVMSYLINKYITKVNLKSNELLEIKEYKNGSLLERIFNFTYDNIWLVDVINVIVIIVYHLLEIYVTAPESYPWIYPMFNAAFSFGNFMLFYIMAQLRLYSIIFEMKN